MPTLNVLSWNSNGENAAKAECLQRVIEHLRVTHNWIPDAIFIQEANTGGLGEIQDYLNTSGLFQNPVTKIPEGGNQGRSYLMAVGNGVQVTRGFGEYALSGDPDSIQWVQSSFTFPWQQVVGTEITDFRNLGIVELTVDDSLLRIATWHAPRGNSVIGTAPSKMPGGANPDAFLSLENSELYDWLTQLDAGQASAIIGDLNVDKDQIHDPIVLPDGSDYEVLQGWSGYAQNLDYIIGRFGAPGEIANGFTYPDCTGFGLSDHQIIGGTISW